MQSTRTMRKHAHIHTGVVGYPHLNIDRIFLGSLLVIHAIRSTAPLEVMRETFMA